MREGKTILLVPITQKANFWNIENTGEFSTNLATSNRKNKNSC